jgi:uncharacterized protein
MFTPEVLASIERSVLCWLATADADGFPNVSPKEVFCAHGDDMLLIAHIASPNSVRNLKANPQVCVALVDVFRQRGHKLKGLAEVVGPDDPRFPELAAPLQRIAGPVFQVRAVIAVTVDSAVPILAPSYLFVPGTTEASQIDSALRTYGVAPRD